MPLSRQERSAINKANASHSTGPVTEAGKNISKRNALKHSLTAQQLTLPDDDPAETQELLERWLDDYQPQTAAQEHLLEQCVAAALLQKRVTRSHFAAVSEQVRRAASDLETRRASACRENIKMLKGDPREVVERLMETSHGLFYLRNRWNFLGDEFNRKGFWSDDERDEVIRLLGQWPGANRLVESPDAWKVYCFNGLCRVDPTHAMIRWLTEPARMPSSMRDFYRDTLPAREDCVEYLSKTVAGVVEEIEERLPGMVELDDAESDAAPEVALTLQDDRKARLMLRYQSEARSAFHKAHDALMKSLKEDRRDGSRDEDAKAGGRAALAEPVAHEEGPAEEAMEAPKSAENVEPRNEPKPAATPVTAKASVEFLARSGRPEEGPRRESLLESVIGDVFGAPGGPDVLPIRIGKGPEGPRRG
jgi:hypothetical protein